MDSPTPILSLNTSASSPPVTRSKRRKLASSASSVWNSPSWYLTTPRPQILDEVVVPDGDQSVKKRIRDCNKLLASEKNPEKRQALRRLRYKISTKTNPSSPSTWWRRAKLIHRNQGEGGACEARVIEEISHILGENVDNNRGLTQTYLSEEVRTRPDGVSTACLIEIKSIAVGAKISTIYLTRQIAAQIKAAKNQSKKFVLIITGHHESLDTANHPRPSGHLLKQADAVLYFRQKDHMFFVHDTQNDQWNLAPLTKDKVAMILGSSPKHESFDPVKSAGEKTAEHEASPQPTRSRAEQTLLSSPPCKRSLAF